MTKGQGKRGHHKRDVDKLNRTAFIVGGVIAVAVLLVVIASVLF